MRTIGHVSGKTLFCRLLRYCLGEQRFADETKRAEVTARLEGKPVRTTVIAE